MTSHAGRRGQRSDVHGPRRLATRTLLLAAAATATLVAWGFLVWSAIDFGVKGRDGEAPAWFFAALATLGAVACLFLALILAGKVVAAVKRGSDAAARPPGGRRAAR